MTSEETAAWVQAIASIVGLAAAFLFPWREILATRKTRNDEAAARKQLLLRRVVSSLSDTGAVLEGRMASLRPTVESQRMHGSAGHVHVSDFDFGPQYLDSLVEEAYLLGAAAAGELADVAESLEEFRRGLTREVAVKDVQWADARLTDIGDLFARVAALRKALEPEITRVPIRRS